MKKILIITILACLALFVISWGFLKLATFFSPGTYGDATKYTFEVPEEILIQKLTNFKNYNNNFELPDTLRNQLIDKKFGENEENFRVNFYLKDEKIIVFTYVTRKSDQQSTLVLVSINEGIGLGNWKSFNKELNEKESEKYIIKIENEILKKINLKYNEQP